MMKILSTGNGKAKSQSMSGYILQKRSVLAQSFTRGRREIAIHESEMSHKSLCGPFTNNLKGKKNL